VLVVYYEFFKTNFVWKTSSDYPSIPKKLEKSWQVEQKGTKKWKTSKTHRQLEYVQRNLSGKLSFFPKRTQIQTRAMKYLNYFDVY
jgi:hypothetical protein